MTEQERLATLTQIPNDLIGDNTIELTMHTVRKDVPGWHAFHHVNVIVPEYGIKFRSADIESFRGVGAVVKAIETAPRR